MIKYNIIRQENLNENTKSISDLEESSIVQFQHGRIDDSKLINNVPELVTKIEEEKIRNIKVGETLSLTRTITETLFITKKQENK